MKASEALQQAWSAASEESGQTAGYYYRRVTYPGLLVYAGIVIPGRFRAISIQADQSEVPRRDLEDSTRGYKVTVDPQPNGRVSIHLQEAGQVPARDLFLILSADVLDHVSRCANESEGVRVLRNRLLYWKRFFQVRSPGGLSREEYIGLYAELDFLRVGLVAGMDPEKAVRAWQGPLGANQDFLLGRVAAEVKGTTGNQPNLVFISNVRQLDDAGLDHLFLWQGVYDFREDTGETLAMLVSRLKMLLESSPSVVAVLEERLLAAGFIEPACSSFERYGFSSRFRRTFRVGAGFPRLLESYFPAGVQDVRYTLDLAACASFEVKEDRIIATMGNA